MAMQEPETRAEKLASSVFLHIEHTAYVLLGALLAGTAAVTLLKAGKGLISGMLDFDSTGEIVGLIDQLLFVFMLIEILHTVRASLRSGGLSCEPFLVVGLIASIRRVLVITLETSQAPKQKGWTPETISMLHYSMIELGVMGGLILAMVLSIYLLHRARPENEEPVGSSF